ncbi:protein lin-52 homolog isoform X1 [Chironomus tepperi]|uniref:protein lin-52 homolog isoform X1 n=1 Tax=Chironomus tepperi TaxID=113505 RepID=UPI00391FB6AC
MSTAEDNFLLSSENLRASPELWPEKIPGSDNFTKTVSKHVKENENGLTQDDIRNIYQLGSLPKTEIVAEIRRLYDEGYQLGVEEAKEVTRGKYLNIFTSNAPLLKRK